LKAKKVTFGLRRLFQPLSKEQSHRLGQIADFLTLKLSPSSGMYTRIFNLPEEFEEDLKEIQPPGLKIRKYFKLTKEQKADRKA
jgi:hypothetical protein